MLPLLFKRDITPVRSPGSTENFLAQVLRVERPTIIYMIVLYSYILIIYFIILMFSII